MLSALRGLCGRSIEHNIGLSDTKWRIYINNNNNNNMKNLITITPHKDAKGRELLTISLTIDGAKAIQDFTGTNFSIQSLYYNDWQGDDAKILIHEDAEKIELYTKAMMLHGDNFVIKRFHMKDRVNIVKAWVENPKEEFEFFADHGNDDRVKLVTAMLAASMWAVYSPQTVEAAAFETQKRYKILKETFQGVMDAIKFLNFDNYAQDDIYYEKIKEVANLMDKEMDFCIEKMKVIELVCERDFSSSEVVSKAYRKFRGVNELDNKTSINSTTETNEELDINEEISEGSNDTEGNVGSGESEPQTEPSEGL